MTRQLVIDLFVDSRFDVRWGLWGLLILFTTGCAPLQPFVVEQPNMRGKQVAAAITVSDPQVYARESLVNDRLIESRLLKKLLDESGKIEGEDDFRKRFVPQINRDLATLSALKATASATIDPAQATEQRRSERAAQLDSEIERYKKLAELEQAKYEYRQARDGTGNNDSGDSTGASEDTEASNDNVSSSEKSDASESDSASAESEEEPGSEPLTTENTEEPNETEEGAADDGGISFDLAKLKELQQIEIGTTEVKADPLDQFRDLQAYRAELRQAMSEIGLDDLHDYDGNALYRMQFKLTSAPGKHQNKFGVARLTFLPPRMEGIEVKSLYYTWLAHITSRINQPGPTGYGYITNENYARLGARNLFGVVEIPYVSNPPKDVEDSETGIDPCFSGEYQYAKPERFVDCKSLLIAVPTAYEEDIKRIINAGRCEALEKRFVELRSRSAIESFYGNRKVEEIDPAYKKACLGSQEGLKRPGSVDGFAQFSASLMPLLSGSLSRGGQLSKLARTNILRWILDADSKLDSFHSDYGKYSVQEDWYVSKSFETFVIPGHSDDQNYCERLPNSSKTPSCKNVSSDTRMYAYNVLPLNQHQRMSDVMKTANSIEVGLDLAATLTGDIVNGSAGLNYMRQTMANVEAIERTPILVGFADRAAPVDFDKRIPWLFWQDPSYRRSNIWSSEDLNSQLPQVGWIMGPSMRINAKEQKLELVQRPLARRVAADVSMPAWWPKVRVMLETGWVGDWKGGSEMLKTGDKREGIHFEEFEVPMPLNTADLDALTNYLSRRTTGSNIEELNIQMIEPENISACSKEVEVLVEGANVWRSSEVFLGGIAAEEVRILPNMDGIAAKFDMDKLFATPNFANVGLGLQHYVTFSLWTRNGSDTRELRLVGSRNAKGCVSKTSVATRPKYKRAELVHAAPTVIDACAKETSFVAKVYRPNRSEDLPTFLLGSTVAHTVKPIPEGAKNGQTFQATFKGGPFAKAPDSPNVALTVVEDGEISSVPVMLRKCSAAPVEMKASVVGSVVVSSASSADPKPVKIAVNLKITNGKAQKTDRLAVRVVDSADQKWYPSTITIPTKVDSKKIATVNFEFKPDSSFTEGAILEFAITKSDKSTVGASIKELSGKLVYYSSQEEAAFKGKILESDSKTILELTYPKKWEVAYPKAKLATFVYRPDQFKFVSTIQSPASVAKNVQQVEIGFDKSA